MPSWREHSTGDMHQRGLGDTEAVILGRETVWKKLLTQHPKNLKGRGR